MPALGRRTTGSGSQGKANATNMNAPTGSSGRPGNCTNCIDSWDGGRQKQIPWRKELGLSYRPFGRKLVVVIYSLVIPGMFWNGLHSKIFCLFLPNLFLNELQSSIVGDVKILFLFML